jgi:hypothetical protein
VIDTLLSLYDTEKNEEVKDQIMNALGSGSVVYSDSTRAWVGQLRCGCRPPTGRMSDQRVIL